MNFSSKGCCEICKRSRAHFNHDKCSKKKQKVSASQQGRRLSEHDFVYLSKIGE